MKYKIKMFAILLLFLILISGCTSNGEEKNVPINYLFEEPLNFPFIIDNKSTEIDILDPNKLHQFMFRYKNTETSQEIKYTLSKFQYETKDNRVSTEGKIEYKTDSGLFAYYEENSSSQSLWWESKDGFLARIIYTVPGTDTFDEHKLKVEELLDIANQVID